MTMTHDAHYPYAVIDPYQDPSFGGRPLSCHMTLAAAAKAAGERYRVIAWDAQARASLAAAPEWPDEVRRRVFSPEGDHWGVDL